MLVTNTPRNVSKLKIYQKLVTYPLNRFFGVRNRVLVAEIKVYGFDSLNAKTQTGGKSLSLARGDQVCDAQCTIVQATECLFRQK